MLLLYVTNYKTKDARKENSFESKFSLSIQINFPEEISNVYMTPRVSDISG